MKSKLIVFSIIYIAPPTYKTPYAVAIAEDMDGKRMLVRIKEEYQKELKNGLEGDVKKEPLEDRQLNFFYPKK